jgi:hypothetical protein
LSFLVSIFVLGFVTGAFVPLSMVEKITNYARTEIANARTDEAKKRKKKNSNGLSLVAMIMSQQHQQENKRAHIDDCSADKSSTTNR